MVTTVGRVSGQPRRTMLVTPYQDSRGMVLVASNGGAEAHPQWYRNLTKTPEVLVLMSGRRRQMRPGPRRRRRRPRSGRRS
jgi:deazaflavin-dependent oxidoreductase (nitroreductase family)